MDGLVSRRYFDQAHAARAGGRAAPRSATSRSAGDPRHLPRRPGPAPAAPTGLAADPEHILLKPKQAGRLLGISPRTLGNWRHLGRGPKFVKVGTAVRYRLSDLDAFTAASIRRSTSDPGPAGDDADGGPAAA